MAHDGTTHEPESAIESLPNASGLTSSAVESLPNTPGLTSSAASAVQTIGIAVEDIALPGITDNAVTGAMPSEPICPVIPGVSFPKLPEIPDISAALGDVFKNPPSPSDLMKALANKGSSAAKKLAMAANNAVRDTAAKVEENLAVEFDKVANGYSKLEAAKKAIDSGAIDLSSLGMNALGLPGAVLAGAFGGFKKASECLTGEPGSAEAEFNAKSPALDEEGRGENAATAEAKTEKVTNADGVEVVRTISETPDEATAAVAETTKSAVPRSNSPILIEHPILDDPEYRTVGIGVGINAGEFTTFGGRDLMSDETTRLFSGLYPIFIRGVAMKNNRMVIKRSWGRSDIVIADPFIVPGITMGEINALIDAWFTKKYELDGFTQKKVDKKWQESEDRRLFLIDAFTRRGEWPPIPGRYLKPEPKLGLHPIGVSSWRVLPGTGPWHPSSYDINVSSAIDAGYDPNHVPEEFHTKTKGSFKFNSQNELVKV